MKSWTIAVAALLALLPIAARAAEPITATVAVRADQPGPVINRNIYGQFAEHLGRGIYEGVWVGEKSSIPNTNGYRNDVVAALKRLRVPVIRWPGGCFADMYHWREGIGPRAKRPKRVNRFWGGVIEDNSFGTHEFMNFAELIGADAYVAGNMGSGTPQEMNEWLEYLTATGDSTLAQERRRNGRDKPWKVKFFGVGNETWGCGGDMRPEYSADLHRRYGAFVYGSSGDKITKVASGANNFDYNFTRVMMERAAPKMDAISLHYYTVPGDDWEHKGPATGFDEAAWAITLKKAARIDEVVTGHAAEMDKVDPDKRVGLFVDEWGTWYDQEPGSTPGFLYQQNTLRDAMVAALSLDVFHRHADRVRMTNIAQMVNVLQAMILTDKEKMVLTPTYHVFEMYTPFQGATFLPAAVSSATYTNGKVTLPAVDASAARGADGRLRLALVNVDPNRPARITTDIAGANPTRAAGRILTGPAMDTHNSFADPNSIQPAPFAGRVENGRLVFDLPPKSIAVVAID